MKPIILFCALITFNAGWSQSGNTDSLKQANIKLNTNIFDKIKHYENEGYDFLLFRAYDSLSHYENRCRFMVRRDSCTWRYALKMNRDYTVSHVSISSIDYYEDNPCYDELGEAENSLSAVGGYFKGLSKITPELDKFPYILFGRISGKYIYETFDSDFLTGTQRGILYHIICAYMGEHCAW